MLEKATYGIYFAFIRVGTAQTTLYHDPQNGTYRVVSTAKTIGIIDKIYRVRDKMESLFTKECFLKYKARIREGHYHRDDLILYDPQSRTLTYFRNGKLKRKAHLPPPIFDMVSAYYAFRSRYLKSTGALPFLVTSGKRDVRPRVVHRGRRTISVNGTKLTASRILLFVPVKGLLVSRNPKKPTVLFVEPSTGAVLKSVVPTRWGSIKVVLKKLRRENTAFSLTYASN